MSVGNLSVCQRSFSFVTLLFTIDKATLFDPTSTYNCDDKESRANCCDDTTHYPDEHLDLGHSCAFTVIEV